MFTALTCLATKIRDAVTLAGLSVTNGTRGSNLTAVTRHAVWEPVKYALALVAVESLVVVLTRTLSSSNFANASPRAFSETVAGLAERVVVVAKIALVAPWGHEFYLAFTPTSSVFAVTSVRGIETAARLANVSVTE